MTGAVLAAFLGSEPPGAQESEHFTIDSLSIGGAGAQAGSARFDLLATIAEADPVGTASVCNGGFAASLGFLSVYGEAPVANLLLLKPSQGNPAHPELVWSGSADNFEVYRHHSAATLVDPAHLFATTTDCSFVDTDPPAGQVVFYSILPVVE